MSTTTLIRGAEMNLDTEINAIHQKLDKVFDGHFAAVSADELRYRGRDGQWGAQRAISELRYAVLDILFWHGVEARTNDATEIRNDSAIIVPDAVAPPQWTGCSACGKQMVPGGACDFRGPDPRVPHQDDESRNCHDCGVRVGAWHHPGCDAEVCAGCGFQAISCGCPDDDEEKCWMCGRIECCTCLDGDDDADDE